MNKKVLKSAVILAAAGVMIAVAIWFFGKPVTEKLAQGLSPKLLTANISDGTTAGYRICPIKTHASLLTIDTSYIDPRNYTDNNLHFYKDPTAGAGTGTLGAYYLKKAMLSPESDPNFPRSVCIQEGTSLIQVPFANPLASPTPSSCNYGTYSKNSTTYIHYGCAANVDVSVETPADIQINNCPTSSIHVGDTVQFSWTGGAGNYQLQESLTHGTLVQSTKIYTATSAGQETLIVQDADNSLNSATCNFGVVAAVPTLTTISVTPATSSIATGATQQLTAEGKDQSGNPLATQPTFTWESSDEHKATVSSSGLVTGVAEGSVTITAESETRRGTATVTVSAPTLTTISVTPATASIAVGATQQLTAATTDQNSAPIVATVTWGSSDTAKATVSSSGLVTGVAAGPATITATATSGSTTKTATATVTVAAPTCQSTFELRNNKNQKLSGKGQEPTAIAGTLEVTPGQTYLIKIKDAGNTTSALESGATLPAVIHQDAGDPFVVIDINLNATPGQAGILKVLDPASADCWVKVKFTIPPGRTPLRRAGGPVSQSTTESDSSTSGSSALDDSGTTDSDDSELSVSSGSNESDTSSNYDYDEEEEW